MTPSARGAGCGPVSASGGAAVEAVPGSPRTSRGTRAGNSRRAGRRRRPAGESLTLLTQQAAGRLSGCRLLPWSGGDRGSKVLPQQAVETGGSFCISREAVAGQFWDSPGCLFSFPPFHYDPGVKERISSTRWQPLDWSSFVTAQLYQTPFDFPKL